MVLTKQLILCLLIGMVTVPIMAQEVSLETGVSTQDVFLGESFVYQIKVNGSDSPQQPDLSKLKDFSVTPGSSGAQNQQSVQVINGRMTRKVFKGYVFQFNLSPKRAGTLTIPSFPVHADGKTLKTLPVTIRVKKPAKRDDIKLHLSLSSPTCYVGEPINLNVTWYLEPSVLQRMDERNWKINNPVLSDPLFKTIEIEQEQKPNQNQEVFEGKQFHAVKYTYTIFPQKAGELELPQSSVSCRLYTGRRSQRNQSFSDDFFSSPFGGGRRETEKVIVPSNALKLVVKDVPFSGRPDTFNGLIGRYQIHTSAQPTDVNVGDPITLTMRITGPSYLENVRAPALERQQDLIQDFKIPTEMAPGKVVGNAMVFTQTVRAKHPGVTEIPGIELPYFDTKKGSYETAKSKPIKVNVKATRVVTADDAEGFTTANQGTGETKRKIESLSTGISHNYTSLTALAPKQIGHKLLLSSTTGLILLIIPPVVYALLFVITGITRKRQADPAALAARQAMGKLSSSLNTASTEAEVFDALQAYLGSKLRMQPGAITYKDLTARMNNESALAELKKIFDQCEAARFAGGSDSGDAAALAGAVKSLGKELEKEFK